MGLSSRGQRGLASHARMGREQSEEAQRLLAAIVGSSDDAIMTKDLDDRITSWNPGAERLYGYTAAEMLGQPSLRLVPPELTYEMYRILERLERGERVEHFETVRVRKDGSRVAVSVSVSPLNDASGRLVGASAIARDITERKRAEQDREARARQQAALATLRQMALASPDLSTLMGEAIALVARTLGVEYGAILEPLPDRSALLLRAGVGWKEGLVGRAIVGPDSLSSYTLASGEPVLVADLHAETRFDGRTLLHEHGVVSGVSVIMGGHERPVGVLEAHTTRRQHFTADDVHFLRAVANLLATVSARRSAETERKQAEDQLMHAHQLLEQRVAERTQELSILLEVSRHVASTLDLQPLLGLILDQIKTVAAYTAAGIVAREGDFIRVLEYRGPLPREQVLEPRVAIAHAPGYQEISRRKSPVLIDDLGGDNPLARAFRNFPYGPTHANAHSLLFVPLLVNDRLIGLVRVDHTEAGHFTSQHADLLLTIANQAAVAIENARLYAGAQQVAVLEERARLARELHDAVTQTLFSASVMAELLPQLWDRDQAAGRQRLEDIRRLTRGALAEMRTLLVELRPAALTEAKLGDLLRHLAEALGGHKRLPVTLQVEGDRRLPPDVQVAFYRVAQEALHNVAKHAKARAVEVGYRANEAGVELWVSDDGRGFDHIGIGPGHLGLRIMRERAEAAGAMLTIQSRPGRGTEVRVVWRDPPGGRAP